MILDRSRVRGGKAKAVCDLNQAPLTPQEGFGLSTTLQRVMLPPFMAQLTKK